MGKHTYDAANYVQTYFLSSVRVDEVYEEESLLSMKAICKIFVVQTSQIFDFRILRSFSGKSGGQKTAAFID